jgi:hypothetical protein
VLDVINSIIIQIKRAQHGVRHCSNPLNSGCAGFTSGWTLSDGRHLATDWYSGKNPAKPQNVSKCLL